MRQCETCSRGGEPDALLKSYAKRVADGKPTAQASFIYRFLVDRAGYTLTYAAMMNHLRNCLGCRARR